MTATSTDARPPFIVSPRNPWRWTGKRWVIGFAPWLREFGTVNVRDFQPMDPENPNRLAYMGIPIFDHDD